MIVPFLFTRLGRELWYTLRREKNILPLPPSLFQEQFIALHCGRQPSQWDINYSVEENHCSGIEGEGLEASISHVLLVVLIFKGHDGGPVGTELVAISLVLWDFYCCN